MTITFCKNPPLHNALFIADVELGTVTQTRILGVVIQSNLKWDGHVTEVLKKCNKKLYMLRSLKRFHLPTADLVTVYSGYIRPVLEYGCPVFSGSLTKKLESQLEMIQKRACRIILGKNYTSYITALETCKLGTLAERRRQLSLEFACRMIKNPLVSHWLPAKHQGHQYTLRSNTRYQQYKCKTKRFQDSAIPYFINLLNNKD